MVYGYSEVLTLSFDIAYSKVLKVFITSLVGADIIGVNCRFDHNLSLQTIGLMKEALDKEGLTVHLMMQPVGYLTPDAGPMGLAALPETPLGKAYSKNAHFYWLKRHAL